MVTRFINRGIMLYCVGRAFSLTRSEDRLKNDTLVSNFKKEKDWNQVMSNFELPSTIDIDKPSQLKTEDPEIPRPSRPAYLSKVFIFTGIAVALGNVPLQSAYQEANTKYTALPEITPPVVALQGEILEEAKKPASSTQASKTFAKAVATANKQPTTFNRIKVTKNLTLPQTSLSKLVVNHNTLDIHLTPDNWITHTVKGNESITRIMRKHGLSREVSALKDNQTINSKLSSLKSGDILRIKKTNKKLVELIKYSPNSKNAFVISKKGDSLKSTVKSKLFETRQDRITLAISNSFIFDANRQQIPKELTKQASKIFNRDFDLTNELRKGDQITFVYEQIFHNGNLVANHDIVASELIHNNRSHRAIRFIHPDGKKEYFDDRGYELSKAFKRRSLQSGYRISSKFGSRRHPTRKVHHKHTGTDYAAKHGTPVTATGNGYVKHVGRKGAYGRTIVISHNGGYTTLYAHLSKYAKSLKKGQRVYLGDTIGYVGSSGRSTGPHLHYEFRINGVPHNPEEVKLPNMISLNDSERKKFLTASRNLIRQLDVLKRFAKEKVDISTDFGG
ncbi:MAG: Unknown protein [uncultured Thiotrichaceae bacterium]|uniref:LysM domain-containing protein n=1 Tax=uncultured Thiotrichaceae bacterium TaxID=298394 RepID=A0A6S6U9Q9_9GAMM|nr:MAG: Unknown protein [uncultured Thiotrichaceae bacterium]